MAIIKNIDQLKLTVKVNKSSPFEVWEIFLNDAQDIILTKYLGADLINRLEIIDENSTDEADEKYLKVLPLARRALGPFAIALSTDETSINTGDSGHTVTRTENLAPASDSKIEKANASLENRAWNNLEVLLEYLEQNINDFPELRNSHYFKFCRTKYFPSASVFQESGLIDINYSRLCFEKLRQLIIRIERTEVRELVTEDIDDIIFADKKYESLIEKIRAFIGARVAELHTSQTTRIQRSKNNSIEFKAVVRPLYFDTEDTGNYYSEQVRYWQGKILEALSELGVDLSGGKMDFNSDERKIFNISG